MKRSTVNVIRVFPAPVDRTRGRVRAGNLDLPCRLGRAGPVARKREGDGGTPIGRMRILGIAYRADRIGRPRTGVAIRRIGPDDGWCDDPRSRLYNRPVRLPFGPSHERMWRTDPLYDLVVDLDWNRRPAIRGRGSAIFLHVRRPDGATEGCVAVDRGAVARLVARMGRTTLVVVRP